MNDKLTELVFILDRSGSMVGLESDTIGGFNAMVEKQKKEESEAFRTQASAALNAWLDEKQKAGVILPSERRALVGTYR